MGWWLGFPDQRSDRSSLRHNHVGVPTSRVQPRIPIHVLGAEVAGHQTGNPLPKQADSSAPFIGREGERYAARIFTGLLASVTSRAVASKWVRS
jgi:hypothetical protein